MSKIIFSEDKKSSGESIFDDTDIDLPHVRVFENEFHTDQDYYETRRKKVHYTFALASALFSLLMLGLMHLKGSFDTGLALGSVLMTIYSYIECCAAK